MNDVNILRLNILASKNKFLGFQGTVEMKARASSFESLESLFIRGVHKPLHQTAISKYSDE